MKKIILISLLVFCAVPETVPAQEPQGQVLTPEKRVIRARSDNARWAASVNAVDLGWFFTPGLELQYSLSRHITLDAAAKYNNWTFNDSDAQKRNRQARKEFSVGVRYWPWYTYSGWWLGAEGQYQEYSTRPFDNIYQKEEGDAFGGAISGGYSLPVNAWFNIDFGLGFWLGSKSYRLYEADVACPTCGRRVDSDGISESPSKKFFFLPDEVKISAMFIF